MITFLLATVNSSSMDQQNKPACLVRMAMRPSGTSKFRKWIVMEPSMCDCYVGGDPTQNSELNVHAAAGYTITNNEHHL